MKARVVLAACIVLSTMWIGVPAQADDDVPPPNPVEIILQALGSLEMNAALCSNNTTTVGSNPVKATAYCNSSGGYYNGYVNVVVTAPNGQTITNQTVPLERTGTNLTLTGISPEYGTYTGQRVVLLAHCWMTIPFVGCAPEVGASLAGAWADLISDGYEFDLRVYNAGGTVYFEGTCTDPTAAILGQPSKCAAGTTDAPKIGIR